MSECVTVVSSPWPTLTGTWLAFNECPYDLPPWLGEGLSGQKLRDLMVADTESIYGRGADPCLAVRDLARRILNARAGMR